MLALTSKTRRWEPKKLRLRLLSATAQLVTTWHPSNATTRPSTCPNPERTAPRKHTECPSAHQEES